MEQISGKLFTQMLLNGAHLLANKKGEIDALNVFPVPDGDTGTNMSMTFSNGVKEVKKVEHSDVCDIAKVLSRGLLMGARGNSGVILSQIFRGFSQAVEGMKEINGLQLANAFFNGSRVAYKAVMRPVEGTILTVVREAADYTMDFASKQEQVDCRAVMEKMLVEAKESLKRTPELLPVLAEVGVVDSGGAGLVTVLEGILMAMDGEIVALAESETTQSKAAADLESDEFGYCTEFIIRLTPHAQKHFQEDALKKGLARLGNSIVCVQDEDLVKVHVHTLKPGDALNLGQRYGEFIKLKIENMQEQHENILTNEMNQESKPKQKYALIAVAAGDGLKAMFEELRVDHVISGGQTMNPSTEDFVEAMKQLHAEHIFVLPNNSNIVLAAQQAADVYEDSKVTVIPSKSIPQGLTACMNFNPDVDADMNIAEMNDALAMVKTGQVTYAIKDTTFEGLEIKEGDFMGMLEKDIVVCMPDRLEVTKKLLDRMVDEETEIVTLIAGEGADEEEAEVLRAYVEEKGDIEVEVQFGKQPVYSWIIAVE